ncbi:MAG TPA: translational machinery protein [Polyangia bacterium]|jgi:stalled ribosome rescue protein Dom34
MDERAVWLDSHEARIFHIDGERFDETTLHSPARHLHRHPKKQELGAHDHPDDERHFFEEVAGALTGTGPILILGPSMAKLHLLRYLQKHAPTLESRVVGVETVDHPSDRQIVAHVRHYFHALEQVPAAR